MNELMEKIYRTFDINDIADMIFIFINHAVNANEYNTIDYFLDAIDENMLDANVILAICIMTFCIMDKLQNREEFLNRAEIRLIELLQDENRVKKLIDKRKT